MHRPPGRDLIHRWDGNPMIQLGDLPFRCSDLQNAGVVQIGGRTVMLLSVEMLQGYTQIYQAVSFDGTTFTVDPEPFMTPDRTGERSLYETGGIRDARITYLDDGYYITYLADGAYGWRVGLARTYDFESVEYLGFCTQPDVKGGVLLPEKVDGKYMLFKRPIGGGIWVSYSKDLQFWGEDRVVMMPRGGHWDTSRIGPASAPIWTEHGWLLIYYGAKDTSAGPLYRLGAALLDADDPSHVIARSNVPIISPRETYERIGDLPNMIYSCGAILCGDDLCIYYGGSDSCICLGTIPVAEVVEFCLACAAVQDYLDATEGE